MLSIVTHPAPSLRQRSIEVTREQIGTPELQTFIDDLMEAMFTYDGIGIASPQVGNNIRIFIVNERKGPTAYINPEIEILNEDTQESEEGCLSVPGVWGIVDRAKKVRLTALNRHGRKMSVETKGLYANVYQHELDHLNGILFIDKAKTTEKIPVKPKK